MRKLLFVLLLLAAALSLGACASAGGYARSKVPIVTSPAVANVTGVHAGLSAYGVDVLGSDLVVENLVNSGDTLEVIVAGKVVGKIGPYGVAWDVRHAQFHYDTIPVLVRDIGPNGLFRGFAMRKFSLNPNFPTENLWQVTADQILGPDGKHLSDWHLPDVPAESVAEPQKVEFPRWWLDGKSGIQIAVAYHGYSARCLTRGRNVVIPDGGVYYLEDTSVAGFASWGAEKTILCYVVKDGRTAAAFPPITYSVPPAGSGTNYSYQFLLTPHGVLGGSW